MPIGPLMIIGGAEDKLGKRAILTEFVAASGGSDARIAVVPTASSLGEAVVEVYDALFRPTRRRSGPRRCGRRIRRWRRRTP